MKNMIIRIRKIEERDFPGLIDLFKEFALFEKVPERMMNTVEQMLKEKTHINGFVAVNDKDEIMGYVTCFFAYFTWIGKSLYMDDLYVRPAYRGKGVGTLLINEVIAFAKAENCKKLHWQVSGWNKPAIGFYESLGATIDPMESNCDLVF
ncbi:MAG: GNAT family N-acetyltransferase [Paludibacter sp.]